MSASEADFDVEWRLAHSDLCLINNHCLDWMLDGDSNINIEVRVSNILHCIVYAVGNIYCPVVRSFYSHLIKDLQEALYQWHLLLLWHVNFLIGLSIQETIPVAWVNTTLFDYQGKLRQGPLRLFAWPVPETMADQLNPVGTVVSNIDTVTSVSLDLEFQGYSNAVVYPSIDTVNCGCIINFTCCRWNLVY